MKKKEQSASTLPADIQALIKSADKSLLAMDGIMHTMEDLQLRLERESPVGPVLDALTEEAKRNAAEMDAIGADIERIEQEAAAQEKIEDAEDLEQHSSVDE
jgi:hypothetical protein